MAAAMAASPVSDDTLSARPGGSVPEAALEGGVPVACVGSAGGRGITAITPRRQWRSDGGDLKDVSANGNEKSGLPGISLPLRSL